MVTRDCCGKRETKLRKGIVVFIVFLGLTIGSAITGTVSCDGASYGQESVPAGEMKVVKGLVKDIDWVADKLVVRTFDFGSADEITFLVPEGTEITRGTDTISLADINMSDNVTVEYYGNSLAGLKAVHITVKE